MTRTLDESFLRTKSTFPLEVGIHEAIKYS